MCVELCNLLQKVINNNKTDSKTNNNKTDFKRFRKKYKCTFKNEKTHKTLIYYLRNISILHLDSNKISIDNTNTSTIFHYLYNINLKL